MSSEETSKPGELSETTKADKIDEPDKAETPAKARGKAGGKAKAEAKVKAKAAASEVDETAGPVKSRDSPEVEVTLKVNETAKPGEPSKAEPAEPLKVEDKDQVAASTDTTEPSVKAAKLAHTSDAVAGDATQAEETEPEARGTKRPATTADEVKRARLEPSPPSDDSEVEGEGCTAGHLLKLPGRVATLLLDEGEKLLRHFETCTGAQLQVHAPSSDRDEAVKGPSIGDFVLMKGLRKCPLRRCQRQFWTNCAARREGGRRGRMRCSTDGRCCDNRRHGERVSAGLGARRRGVSVAVHGPQRGRQDA